ncbi:hypothetical protein ILYODFUR_019340 [Ilyodon furcidens]|uniref:Uncharacterized protein n=1 Tax=Ilyodon furcidens TaxID=33524 RepID=A0ABV0U6P1_9TELE
MLNKPCKAEGQYHRFYTLQVMFCANSSYCFEIIVQSVQIVISFRLFNRLFNRFLTESCRNVTPQKTRVGSSAELVHCCQLVKVPPVGSESVQGSPPRRHPGDILI